MSGGNMCRHYDDANDKNIINQYNEWMNQQWTKRVILVDMCYFRREELDEEETHVLHLV